MQWSKTRMKFRVCEIHQVQGSKDKKEWYAEQRGEQQIVLFIYMADGTKNIQTPGKLANYNFDKDFQLTVTGEETLKETHIFHTKGNFKS